MLTSDLVRATLKDGKLLPRYLTPKDCTRLVEPAKALIRTCEAMVGSTVGELEEALARISFRPHDRARFLGLRKLCEDRLEVAPMGERDPAELRKLVFQRAAAAHRDPQKPYDRETILREVSESLKVSLEVIERELYADLREAQVIGSFRRITEDELFARYDISLAQAVVLKATQLRVVLHSPDPTEVRTLFRALRFHGLLFDAKAIDSGYELTIDGPFSLFDSVQKYGLRLAIWLGQLMRLRQFSVQATVRWKDEPASFELSSELAVAEAARRISGEHRVDRPLLTELEADLRKTGSEWTFRPTEKILTTRHGAAIVPDGLLKHRTTGEELYVELFGFWSRQAVFQRIEQVQEGLAHRLLLLAQKNLRVSEELIDEASCDASLYVFGSRISPKEIVRRAEAIVAARRDRP